MRYFVFKFCESKNIKSSSQPNISNGRKGLSERILKTHPDNSLRIPETTSIQRAIGFNKTKVDRYMQLLQTTIFDENGNRAIHEGNIINVDGSGFTICHKTEL